ncbi:PH domain-containing protein [Savagea faecisuis]|uniref:PH domain-containing protein n=1 Tax=Savagea faecisuis TaxID=1274803 RepID=A0ABW3GYF8_9BACL
MIIWGANASLLWDVIVHPSITGYVVIIAFIPFISFLWFKTGYEIIEQQLIIRSGPFKSTIPIADIKKLTLSKTLLAGPALSYR